jgi:hypothetical protein
MIVATGQDVCAWGLAQAARDAAAIQGPTLLVGCPEWGLFTPACWPSVLIALSDLGSTRL